MHQYENWYHTKDEKKMAVDMLQWNLGCCGLNGPQDWVTFAPSMFRGTEVPNSCCFDPMIGASATCSLSGVTPPFTKGCAMAIEDTFRVYIGVIAGVTIGISVIQLIAACFACMLSNALYN
ncbi:CD63 antigen-like protein [Leptotrombidium deliense]|uniref:CD63 antigen-like protein n=1 Tax=Leptotrombidium deliense TaxID=299467 RepID=A0A443RWK2_9ACAR|nr:CD63 antigen-like protein [Leptotrombidium deliense]